MRLLPTPTARSRKVTQRKQTFTESASSLRASVIITGSNCGHSLTGMGRIRPVSPNGCTPTDSPPRSGGLGLLRDLHDLYLLASYLDMAWMVVGQAAKGARDQELIRTVEACDKELESQQQWLMTRMKAAAPQALLVAD